MRQRSLSHFGRSGMRLGSGLLMLMCLVSFTAYGQSFSPYSDFQAMNLTQLQTLQIKLTYVGVQDKGVPSVAFTSTSQALDLTKFVPFHRSDVDYSNDNFKVNAFTATPQELQAVIANVGTLPRVTAGLEDPDQFLSFSMVNAAVGNKGFEAVLNLADTADLFAKLRLALQSNPIGLKRINELGCPLAVIDPARPTDVSAHVPVALSGMRLNRTTGHFVSTATLTNSSGAPIAGPLSLVVDLAGNVRLVNATGTTCGTVPAGVAFINVPLSGNVLGTTAVIVVPLEFSNPDSQSITPVTKLLAGPGAR